MLRSAFYGRCGFEHIHLIVKRDRPHTGLGFFLGKSRSVFFIQEQLGNTIELGDRTKKV
ncbi:hypothetical protein H6G81_00250 [Scytonema hofmannii FACHB-248]|uniref:Transposase n=1 Tax=Scytonema hofmannii FACHB-248 TaxID=1842502 RepID=A0ABR8GHZ1_9CYAN|nr:MULTISPECIES: hypothetical protein [Nostocales]MBD2602987.1 hypothetical protein [Scytonema hofmannii FACHB-248]